MNLKNKKFNWRFRKMHAWLWLLASPLAVMRVSAIPGIIVNPAPAPTLTPPAMDDTITNNPMEVFIPAGTGANDLPEPFQYGPIIVRPHVDYSFLYGNGIQAAPTNQQNTIIQEISPGIAVDLGKHWSLDYTPTIRFYSNNQFKDGVDHSFSLVGGTHYEDWTFGLSQNFSYTTAPSSETAAQTEEQIFGTALNASYVINDKMSLDLSLNQTLSYADQFQNTREWSTMDWLNYELWPRLSVGVGAGVGYENVDIGPDETYQQLQARVAWRATDKISFQISAGGEDRQYADSSQPNSLTPIFSGAIQYQPFLDTQISVNASRMVSPSLFPGADTTATSFGINLDQVLFRKFHLNLEGAYNISKYKEIEALSILNYNFYYFQNRTDDNYTFTARLSHPFFRRGTWSVFYQYGDNQSTDKGFGYESSQIGFEISYRY